MSAQGHVVNDGQTLSLTLPAGQTAQVVLTNTSTQGSAAIASYTWKSNGTQVCGNSLTCNVSLTTPTNTVSLAVTDNNALTSTASGLVSITFQGPNIQAPNNGIPTLTVGNPIVSGINNNFQAQGGTPPYTWSATGLPPGVGIGTSSGGLTGTPTQAGSFNVILTVKDANNNTGTFTFTLTVNLLPLKITNGSGQTPVMPVGTVGVAYTSPVIAATGGSQSGYTLTITGQPPPGVTANPISGCSGPGCNLILSGTPTQQGTFSFSANATDSLNDSAQLNLQIIINPSNATPPHITSPSPLPGATIGQSYSFTFAATGGTGALQWSLVGGSPDSALQLSSAGVLSGTPSQPNDCQGVYGSPASFQVKVTDTNNVSDSKPFCVSEFYATPTVSGISPSSVTTDGQAHTIQVQGAGFQPTSQIQFGSAPIATTYIDSNTLSFTLQPGSNGSLNFFTLPGGAEVDAGSYSIRVLTPFSSSSNSSGFTISN
jgi:hypothetical protein